MHLVGKQKTKERLGAESLQGAVDIDAINSLPFGGYRTATQLQLGELTKQRREKEKTKIQAAVVPAEKMQQIPSPVNPHLASAGATVPVSASGLKNRTSSH